MQSGLEDYAENIKKRGTVKDVDQLIQETGNAWHSTPDPTPEAVAFEKFLYCAVPGLAKMKDAQALLEFLADQCFKKDPVAFMDKVRADCGNLLNVADKEAKVNPKSIPTWKATHKQFFEDDARQLQAWESCGKRSRKGKKEGRSGELPADRQRLHGSARGRGQRGPVNTRRGKVRATRGRPGCSYICRTSTHRMPARRAACRPKSVSS